MVENIWWDPGHGGSDPGAIGNGLKEADLTLKIVRYAMTYLESYYYGFEQRTTRTSDVTVELTKRDDSPNAWPADVFVSVHINAGGGTGFESYVYNGAGAASIALQNILHAEILAAMRQYGLAITDRGKKRANYAVLSTTNMPSILTENLFIDSNDANRLKDEAFIKAVGEAHARGVAKYLGLPNKETNFMRMLQDKSLQIVTGGLNQQMMKEISEFLVTKNWGGNTSSVRIGIFPDGSDMLVEMENWLKNKNWYYQKQ